PNNGGSGWLLEPPTSFSQMGVTMIDRTRRRGNSGRVAAVRLARRLVASVVAAVIPLWLVGTFFASSVAAEDGAVKAIATVPLANDPSAAQSGNEVMIDAGARRVVYWSAANNSIRSYDLDTFKMAAESKGFSVQAFFPWALDARRHILYHLQTTAPPITVQAIDTRTLQTTSTVSLLPDMGDLYAGMYWSDRDQLLYMVYSPGVIFQGAGRSTAIAAIDPTAANPVIWSATLNGCGAPLAASANNAAALGQTNDGRYLYTVCTTGAGSSDVARLTLPADPRSQAGVVGPAVDLFPGLVTPTGSSALWVPGADRMLTMVASNGGNGWSAYVFDADALHFTG